MRRATLLMNVTVKEWAEWLYVSLRTWNKEGEKFYDRISWEKLLRRLKVYGYAELFWNAWKDIKERYNKSGEIKGDYINDIIDKGFILDVQQLKLDSYWDEKNG